MVFAIVTQLRAITQEQIKSTHLRTSPASQTYHTAQRSEQDEYGHICLDIRNGCPDYTTGDAFAFGLQAFGR